MVERKLSKAQGHIIQTLAQEQAQIQQRAQEEQAAIGEQAEMLRKHFGLPEGKSRLVPGPDGWRIVVEPGAGADPDEGAGDGQESAE